MTCPECSSSNLDYDADNDRFWCKDCTWREPLIDDYDDDWDDYTEDDNAWERLSDEDWDDED
jgi:hypothetical protein